MTNSITLTANNLDLNNYEPQTLRDFRALGCTLDYAPTTEIGGADSLTFPTYDLMASFFEGERYFDYDEDIKEGRIVINGAPTKEVRIEVNGLIKVFKFNIQTVLESDFYNESAHDLINNWNSINLVNLFLDPDFIQEHGAQYMSFQVETKVHERKRIQDQIDELRAQLKAL